MDNITQIIQKQKEYFNQGHTRDYTFRYQQLQKLAQAVREQACNIAAALNEDLHKPLLESYTAEISVVLEEIKFFQKHLKKLVRPRRVKTPLINFLAKSYIVPEPYGNVLIMTPWNYPVQLSLTPLVGAIAAGNCAIIKPSEFSSKSSQVIAKIIQSAFEPQYCAVVQGGQDCSAQLLEQEFDYIFFVGSSRVGKIVMNAAAQHLTPLTLELGGKSPCIVDETVNNIDLAAKRIVWGKFVNAGQTCIAPDYVLVHHSKQAQLIEALKKWCNAFYGVNPQHNDDYAHIINHHHFQRLQLLLSQGDVVWGGEVNEESLYIAPTIMIKCDWNSALMQEEIFGPILPVVSYTSLDESIKRVNRLPKPLALYLFSQDRAVQKRVIREISFGGGCINDTLSHGINLCLPFGGVGASGIGKYRGKASFETFSHQKAITDKSLAIDIAFRYPPYGNKYKMIKKMFKCT